MCFSWQIINFIAWNFAQSDEITSVPIQVHAKKYSILGMVKAKPKKNDNGKLSRPLAHFHSLPMFSSSENSKAHANSFSRLREK